MRKYHCKDTNEIVYGYTSYLKTKHWKLTRERMYNSKYKYECYCCSHKYKLQLHHKSYKTVGNENLTHLIWLCSNCHTKIHEKLDKSSGSNTNLWNVARKVRKQK